MAWILAVFGFLGFYYFFDPVKSDFMPQCIFHRFTGLQCMGCGSQRVIHALLHGDLVTAFQANALLVIALPFILSLLALEIFRGRFPGLYSKIHSLGFIITISAILIAWLILRNIFGF